MLPDNAVMNVNERTWNDGSAGVELTFLENSELQHYSVAVVSDSRIGAPFEGDRLTTIVAKFPRCILAEVNTHRHFSRNSASSRARSIKVVIQDVMENPYIPLFTENQKGMSGPFVSLQDQKRAKYEWLRMRDAAVAGVLSMLTGTYVLANTIQDRWKDITDHYYETVYLGEGTETSLNLHKQNVNRLLEPFMWHEAVITSSYWNNFIELRDHDDADPAIHALGRLIREALMTSTPEVTHVHVPFAKDVLKYSDSRKNIREACDASAGMAAQVSYRPAGNTTPTDPQKLAKRLLDMQHLSPFEHAAVSRAWMRDHAPGVYLGESNFSNQWVQYRSIISERKY